MTQGYYRTAEAAKYMGIGQSTLERLRISGEGPAFRRLGLKTVVYAVADLDAWAGPALNRTGEGLDG